MPLYFAFGSNLELAQMDRRCPTARLVDRAVVRGYRLGFPRYCPTWYGGVASIEPADGHRVEGAVYDVSDAELGVLDEYEDVEGGDYRRETRQVLAETHGPLDVWTYIANPDPEGPTPPSRVYRDALVRGANDHGLSADYIAMLRQLPTCD